MDGRKIQCRRAHPRGAVNNLNKSTVPGEDRESIVRVGDSVSSPGKSVSYSVTSPHSVGLRRGLRRWDPREQQYPEEGGELSGT